MATHATSNGSATRTIDRSAPQRLRNIFQPAKSDFCQRCGGRVYQMEKVGPVNEVVFHQQCFKCCACAQKLTLRNYFTNSADVNDTEIYCSKHAPRDAAKGLDASALGIRSALNAQQVSRTPLSSKGATPNVGADAMFINHPVNQSRYRKHKHMTYSKHHFPAFLVSRIHPPLLPKSFPPSIHPRKFKLFLLLWCTYWPPPA